MLSGDQRVNTPLSLPAPVAHHLNQDYYPDKHFNPQKTQWDHMGVSLGCSLWVNHYNYNPKSVNNL